MIFAISSISLRVRPVAVHLISISSRLIKSCWGMVRTLITSTALFSCFSSCSTV